MTDSAGPAAGRALDHALINDSDYVDADRATPGTPLRVNVRGAAEPVAVVTLPFHRHNR